jgi:hypothetical protein
MKKITLLLICLQFLSCSSDSSNESITEGNVIPDLSGVTLTPQNSVVYGFGEHIPYRLEKGNTILENYNYKWTTNDTTHGLVYAGDYMSRIIGESVVSVSDEHGNTVSATVNIKPTITTIYDIPYVKWGATTDEIIRGMKPEWTLTFNRWPFLEVMFKRGNDVIKYSLGSEGLATIEYMQNYNFASLFGGETMNVSTFVNYNSERFIELKHDDPHYYGYKRWFHINEFNQKVYVDIEVNQTSDRWKLRYSRS